MGLQLTVKSCLSLMVDFLITLNKRLTNPITIIIIIINNNIEKIKFNIQYKELKSKTFFKLSILYR